MTHKQDNMKVTVQKIMTVDIDICIFECIINDDKEDDTKKKKIILIVFAQCYHFFISVK